MITVKYDDFLIYLVYFRQMQTLPQIFHLQQTQVTENVLSDNMMD